MNTRQNYGNDIELGSTRKAIGLLDEQSSLTRPVSIADRIGKFMSFRVWLFFMGITAAAFIACLVLTILYTIDFDKHRSNMKSDERACPGFGFDCDNQVNTPSCNQTTIKDWCTNNATFKDQRTKGIISLIGTVFTLGLFAYVARNRNASFRDELSVNGNPAAPAPDVR